MNRWIAAAVATCLLGSLGGRVAAVRAAGWEQRDFESPLGDRVMGIATAASNEPDFTLAVGCDGDRGDRWRGVAVLEASGSPRVLESPVPGPVKRQRVRVAFDDATPVQDTFQIRRSPRGETILWIPEPSRFLRALLDHEKQNSASSLHVVLFLKPKGKSINLKFPLDGLGAAFSPLSRRCRDWEP